MIHILQRLRAWLEFFGGAADNAPTPIPARWLPWIQGIWWATLAGLIATFCGQTSKFIYIDF